MWHTSRSFTHHPSITCPRKCNQMGFFKQKHCIHLPQDQVSLFHHFIMIYDSIIHTLTGRTLVAARPLGNTSVCSQYAALAGIRAIILERSILCGARRTSCFLQNSSPESSMWTLLGWKDSKQKYYSWSHAQAVCLHTS